MTSTTIENPPTYSWAMAVGAVSSVIGLIVLAVCIYASVTGRTEQGFAPVPAGVSALACVMVIGGLVLCLFRILHADREELDVRMDRLVTKLEALDRKLNAVWGIAATTSIEAQPARTEQHTRRRGRRARKDRRDAPAGEGTVVPPSSLEVRRAARRLLDRVTRDDARGEDKREDKS